MAGAGPRARAASPGPRTWSPARWRRACHRAISTNTVEIDPDLEGVELEAADELAEPPPPRPHTEDLGDDDVVLDEDLRPDDDDVVEVEAAELIAGGARAQLRGPSYAADDYAEDQATVAERLPSPRAAARDRAVHDRETPRPEPRPAARATSPARPDTGRRGRADSPGLLGARPLEPELARSAAAIDALFPDEDSAPGPLTSAARDARPAKRAPRPIRDALRATTTCTRSARRWASRATSQPPPPPRPRPPPAGPSRPG